MRVITKAPLESSFAAGSVGESAAFLL